MIGKELARHRQNNADEMNGKDQTVWDTYLSMPEIPLCAIFFPFWQGAKRSEGGRGYEHASAWKATVQ